MGDAERIKVLEQLVYDALLFAQPYAAANPPNEWRGSMQDPGGVHAWLKQASAALAQPQAQPEPGPASASTSSSDFDPGARNWRQSEPVREDAQRWRYLRANMTFYNVNHSIDPDAPNVPALAMVSKRIWYHATDDTEHDTLDAMIDAAIAAAREQGK